MEKFHSFLTYLTCSNNIEMVNIMIKLNCIDNIPVISSVELLIIGSGLKAVSLAYYASCKHKNVMLMEQGTHLLPDMGDYLRPWIIWDEQYQDLLKEWFPIEGTPGGGEYCPLNIDQCKLRVEDLLLSRGVEILYGLTKADIRKINEKFHIIAASRSGFYIIEADKVIDTNELFEKEKENCKCAYLTMEFEGVALKTPCKVTFPDGLGVVDNTAQLYPSAFKDNVLLEMAFPIDQNPLDDEQERYKLYSSAVKTIKYLVCKTEGFDNARFGEISYKPMLKSSFSPVKEILEGKGLAENCDEYGSNLDKYNYNSQDSSLREVNVSCKNEFIAYHGGEQQKISLYAKLEKECDVLVVGGGTGGAVAAAASAENGAHTVMLEMNSFPGGTGTVGGVHYYWFGDRKGFTSEVDNEYFALADEIKYPAFDYVWGKHDGWNPFLKSYVLWSRCIKNGVEGIYNSICVGTVMDGKKIKGVVAITPQGLLLIKSKIVIDATGDGDVAALAGAEYVYGNFRDRMTMWSCMAQYKQAGIYRGGIFSTSVDIGDPFDYTRYILVNRRRGTDGNYDHGKYICTRESRHILGDYVVSLKDICLNRKYHDTVSVCYSNLDSKGKSTADLIYFGYLLPQRHVNIPYRSFLSKDMDGMYVIGKAISATHDAIPILRMQDDVQNQGGMAGIAAALCVKKNVGIRELPVNILQRELIKKGVLPESAISDTSDKTCYTDLINGLTGDEPFEYIDLDVNEYRDEPDSIVRICLAPAESVVEDLRRRYDTATGQLKLLLARLLLWHKDEYGLELILETIINLLEQSEDLVPRKGSIKFCQAQPDHGVMCEVTYMVNLLSRCKSLSILSVFELLVKKIEMTKRNYLDIRQSIFNHIESVAYVAERTAFKEFAPLLKRLLSLEEFKNCEVRNIYQFDVDITSERICCLKMILLRTLARIGDKEGYYGLVELLKDKRMVIAKSAADELCRITGKSFGLDYHRWRGYIESNESGIVPVPIEITLW